MWRMPKGTVDNSLHRNPSGESEGEGDLPNVIVGNLGPPRNFPSPQKYACLGIFH